MLFEGLKAGVQLGVQNDRWMSEVWQVQMAGHSRKGPDIQTVNVGKWSKIGFDGKKKQGNRSRCGNTIPLM